MNAIAIRNAVETDGRVINDILNHYVLHSTATFMTEPVSLEERLKWLRERAAAHPVTVAEVAGMVRGWGAIGPFRPRAAYAQTVELSVYVEEGYHRRGLGKAILADLLARARALGHHAVVGGCCGESTGSIGLLEAFGFSKVGHFPQVGRKFDRWLDVVFLQILI